MLYILDGNTYSGECVMPATVEHRAELLAQGRRPIITGGIPSFHTRWVETPAADKEGGAITLTLAEAKEAKGLELDWLTRRFDDELVNSDMHFNSSLGFDVDGDLRSQNNLRGLVSAGAEPVTFLDHDNIAHELTLADINTLLAECAMNGSNLYLQRWAYKAAIGAATTLTELDAIELEFTMMDFTA